MNGKLKGWVVNWPQGIAGGDTDEVCARGESTSRSRADRSLRCGPARARGIGHGSACLAACPGLDPGAPPNLPDSEPSGEPALMRRAVAGHRKPLGAAVNSRETNSQVHLAQPYPDIKRACAGKALASERLEDDFNALDAIAQGFVEGRLVSEMLVVSARGEASQANGIKSVVVLKVRR